MESFTELIHHVSDDSATNQQIAEYLSTHLRDVSFMSSADLAKQTGVSQASITRFCTAMGFAGYGDFVRTLQNVVREEWKAPERTVYLRPSLPEGADPLLLQEIANLEQLPEILESEAVAQLVDLVAKAERVVLAGARISSTLIPYAAYCLGKVRNGIEVATPGSVAWDNFSPTPETLIIGWVFPRYPRVLLEWLEEARKGGVRVAAITDRWMSPAMAWADPALVVPVSNASLFDSYVAPMFLVNYLTRQVAQRIPVVRERLEQLEERDQRLGVYWTRPHH